MRLVIPLGLAALLWASVAFAGGSGTPDSACGCNQMTWDVPNGALVTWRATQAAGSFAPTLFVINNIGEYRTHTMLAHGTRADAAGRAGQWVSHSTSYTPGQQGYSSVCSNPLDPQQLQYGMPGANRMTVSALMQDRNQPGISYWEYKADPDGSGVKIADALVGPSFSGSTCTGGGMSANWFPGSVSGYQGLYRYYISNYNSYNGWVGYYLPYDANMFANLGNLNVYRVSAAGAGSYDDLTPTNTVVPPGIACSSFLTYLQDRILFKPITPKYYNNSLAGPLCSGLYSGTKGDCSSNMGFWTGLLGGLGCADTNGLCDEAGAQVAYMFVSGSATQGANAWVTCGGATAYTVSPDRVQGSVGANQSSYKQAVSPQGTGNSVWAPAAATPTINTAGYQCACWF